MVKVSNVVSIAEIIENYEDFEVGRTYHFKDVVDPRRIKARNYRPIDESNVQSKIHQIARHGIAVPLTLKCDTNREVFCVDGNHRLVASIRRRDQTPNHLDSTHEIPVWIEFLDTTMDQWDESKQTQFNSFSETIVDRALRYRMYREKGGLKSKDIAALENTYEKGVERTLTVLYFTPDLLELIQLHTKILSEKFIVATARDFDKERKAKKTGIEELRLRFRDLIHREIERQSKPKLKQKTETIRTQVAGTDIGQASDSGFASRRKSRSLEASTRKAEESRQLSSIPIDALRISLLKHDIPSDYITIFVAELQKLAAKGES